MRRLGTVLVIAAALPALAGCGAEADVAAEPAPTPAAAKGASASAAQSPRAGAPRTVTVQISDFEFEPSRLIVAPRTRVRWVNRDDANHTVTFPRGPHGPRDLGNVDPRKTLRLRFEKPGTYRYVCQYHPSMVGRIVVRRSA